MSSQLATISGQLTDLKGNPVNGSVSVSLVYPNGSPVGPNDLRLPGTAILATRGAVSTVAGTFSLELLGNDVIQDLAGNTITYYNVAVKMAGSNTPAWSGTYTFNANTNYDLTTINPTTPRIPIYNPPAPVTPLQAALGGTGTSNSPANYAFLGPVSGSPAPGSMRAINTVDLPATINPTILQQVVYANEFSGATADVQIASAIAALSASGGTIDCRGFGSTTQTISSTCLLGYTTESDGGQGQLVTPSLTFIFDPATTFTPNSKTLNMFQVGNNATVRGLNIDTSSQVGYSGYAISNAPMTITNWLVEDITVTMDTTATGVGLALVTYASPAYGQSPSSMIYTVTRRVNIYAGTGATGLLMTQVGSSTGENGWINACKFYDIHVWNAKYGILMASNGASSDGGTTMANNEFYGFEYEASGLSTALAGIAMTFAGTAGVNSNLFQGACYDIYGASFVEFGPSGNNCVNIASGGNAAYNQFIGQFYYNFDGSTSSGLFINSYYDRSTGVNSIGSYLKLANQIGIQWYDTAGVAGGGIVVGSDDNLYINGSSNAEIIFQPKSGTNSITMTDGNLSVYGSATETFATIYAQAYAGGNAVLQLDSPSSQQSIFAFSTASALEWQIGKQSDNSFFLYDSVNSETRMSVAQGGALSFLAHGVCIGVPSGGDQGVGTVNAATAYYINGSAGIGAGPYTSISSLTVEGGLVTALSGSSDERLKDHQLYSGGLRVVQALSPVKYKWNALGVKQTGLKADQEFVGFTAQNVQAAIPEAITATEHSKTKGDTNTYLCIDDRPIVAALVNAMKELATMNAELTAELNKIKTALAQIGKIN